MPQGTLSRADELVSLIGELGPSGAGLTAVVAFPNGHPESGSDRSDIEALLAKQAACASFAITQLFFHTADYLAFVELARSRGVTIDLIPGIMPIVSPGRLARVLELTGEQRPDELSKSLERAEDAASRREVGVAWAANQVCGFAQSNDLSHAEVVIQEKTSFSGPGSWVNIWASGGN